MASARVLLFLASVSLGTRLDAQSLFVGFRAGQSTAVQYWRVPDANGKTERRPQSVASGFSATLELKSWLAFESDLMYVEKGFQHAADDVSIKYAELPVLLRLTGPVPILGPLHLFVHGGPAPSVELSCFADVPIPVVLDRGLASSVAPSVSPPPCANHRATKRDFGWVGGGGVIVRQPGYQITVSMRRTRGVRDLFPKDSFQERLNDTRALLVSVTARAK